MPPATVRLLPVPHYDQGGNGPSWASPLAAYLARVEASTRPALRHKLDAIAKLLSGGRMDAYEFPWQMVRYEQANMVRSHVAPTYAISTANHFLQSLRGILKECYRLGLMSEEDWRRDRSVEPVNGEPLKSRSARRA